MIKHTHIVPALLVAVVILLAYIYVESSQSAVREALELQLAESKKELLATANSVYLNQDDDVVSVYVRDCTSVARAEFDSNLDRLATLNATELERTELLFGACASYFADKKAAGAERLRAAYNEYHRLIDVYASIDLNAHSQFNTEDWELFIGLQAQLAQLLLDQVPIQKDIISLLQEGVSESDPAIRAKIEEAQEITQSATVISRQTDSVFAKLSK